MIKAVIFDHDGVIADTEPISFIADNSVLARYGFSISSEENEALIGISSREGWVTFKEMFKIPEAVDWLVSEKTREAINIVKSSGIKPSEGLLKLISMLQSKGFKLAIASGANRAFIDAVLEKLGISSFFQAIISWENVAKGKPDPEAYIKTSQKLGISPSDCVAIEDSSSGIMAAKAAGMRCVALRMPSTASHDVSMADLVINSLSELSTESLSGLERKQ